MTNDEIIAELKKLEEESDKLVEESKKTEKRIFSLL